ncbi:hypothetical protein [Streptomyces sp. GC420]|uniref:hypothetical protein n=1 Tax=Streptomyces sp. GC420 TaxID=2697568 RepID=UPI001414CFC0|nr:hypothetical protein [Streptomyces sp. GC420]NBM15879.1 hypothetical protein [Streptomyces sp. GC420]
MSLQDDLTAAQRCLDDLVRSVGRVEQRLGSTGLDVRRVRTDTEHLRESLSLLRAAAATTTGRPEQHPSDLVTIPDTPYNSALWTDSDDEGLGARDRHAP